MCGEVVIECDLVAEVVSVEGLVVCLNVSGGFHGHLSFARCSN